jgi:hypothetical protein
MVFQSGKYSTWLVMVGCLIVWLDPCIEECTTKNQLHSLVGGWSSHMSSTCPFLWVQSEFCC